MYVENANRAFKEGFITVDNLEPNPKNPIIAGFFRTIGYADQLGSGVRNMFKYTKYYSGQEPEFIEGDVFKIIVPLDEGYSYDYAQNDNATENHKQLMSADKEVKNADNEILSADKEVKSADNEILSADKVPENISQISLNDLSKNEKIIMGYMNENKIITSHEVEALLGIKQRQARKILGSLVEKKYLEKQGNYRNTKYVMRDFSIW